MDMSRRCQRLAGDVICQLGFGYPLNTQTETTNRPLLEAFPSITGRMALYIQELCRQGGSLPRDQPSGGEDDVVF